MGIGDGVTRNPSVYNEALLLLMELEVPTLAPCGCLDAPSFPLAPSPNFFMGKRKPRSAVLKEKTVSTCEGTAFAKINKFNFASSVLGPKLGKNTVSCHPA